MIEAVWCNGPEGWDILTSSGRTFVAKDEPRVAGFTRFGNLQVKDACVAGIRVNREGRTVVEVFVGGRVHAYVVPDTFEEAFAKVPAIYRPSMRAPQL